MRRINETGTELGHKNLGENLMHPKRTTDEPAAYAMMRVSIELCAITATGLRVGAP